MDPDLVRQQEEAERELALNAALKRANEAAAAAMAARQMQTARQIPVEEQLRTSASADGTRTASDASPRFDFFPGLGRFVSFAVAGAILGIGLGNAAASLLALPFDHAGTTILVTAGATAVLCAMASLFAGSGNAPRAG